MSKTLTYRQHHAELAGMADDIEKLLNPAQVAGNSGQIRARLTAMIAKLNIHLAMEDNGLYPALKAMSNPGLQSMAVKFADEMGGMKPAIRTYSQRWTEPAIKADPPGFTSETRKLFSQLRDRIQRENTQLYAAYDKA